MDGSFYALKARWLLDHGNKEQALYVRELRTNTKGVKGKKLYVKKSRSGNPLTHNLDYLAKKLVEEKKLDPNAFGNILALLEIPGLRSSFL